MQEKAKNWLKQNWFKISLLVIIIAVISGTFYWFQFRPSQIRKECIKYVYSAKAEYGDSLTFEQFSKLQSIYGKDYDTCLKRHGLEK